jgi:hypothetical protein
MYVKSQRTYMENNVYSDWNTFFHSLGSTDQLIMLKTTFQKNLLMEKTDVISIQTMKLFILCLKIKQYCKLNCMQWSNSHFILKMFHILSLSREQIPCLRFLWFSSVPAIKGWNSILKQALHLPSRSFPILHSCSHFTIQY